MFGKGLSISGVMFMTETKKFITEIAMILPTLLIFSVLTHLRDYNLIRKIALVSLISTSITFVYLIPLIVENSDVLRLSLKSDFRSTFIGMPTYPAMHSYIIVLPALLFVFKYSKGWIRYVFASISVLYLYIIFKASITTTVLISIAVILFFLIYRNSIKQTIAFMGLFLVSVFILFKTGMLIFILNFGVTLTEGTYSAGKFEGFRDMFLTGKESSALAARNDLHSISLGSFLKNPLFGGDTGHFDLSLVDADNTILSSDAVIGGHSSLLDRLGGMGLLGFIPFVMIMISTINTWKKFFLTKNAWYFYCVGLSSAAIMLYEKGLFGQEGWFTLTLYLPTLILFGDYHIQRKQLGQSSK